MLMQHSLESAHNLFGKSGFTGEKAVGNDKYHRQIVKGCLYELKKKGMTFCFYEEQLKDIKKMSPHKLKITYLKSEIMIEVEEDNT